MSRLSRPARSAAMLGVAVIAVLGPVPGAVLGADPAAAATRMSVATAEPSPDHGDHHGGVGPAAPPSGTESTGSHGTGSHGAGTDVKGAGDGTDETAGMQHAHSSGSAGAGAPGAQTRGLVLGGFGLVNLTVIVLAARMRRAGREEWQRRRARRLSAVG